MHGSRGRAAGDVAPAYGILSAPVGRGYAPDAGSAVRSRWTTPPTQARLSPRQQPHNPVHESPIRRLEQVAAGHPRLRSEEHPSELPSLMHISYVVFFLTK